MGTKGLSYQIEILEERKIAEQIAQFLVSGQSFDDLRHTPGEINHFRHNPNDSLRLSHYYYWYVRNETNEIIGILSGFENEQRTGGFTLDYIAIHRNYRTQGIASSLIRNMIEYVRSIGGRYILTFTCDLPLYESIQRIFRRFGFERIGYCPDYYYEGEGRLTFYLKL